jgi:hypothetical protein
MSYPRCPACREELTFTHALRMPNPWRYECPECRVALDAAPNHKLAVLAWSVIAAAVVAGAIALRNLEMLTPAASVTFLAACAVSMLAGAVWLWERTTFTRKSRSG